MVYIVQTHLPTIPFHVKLEMLRTLAEKLPILVFHVSTTWYFVVSFTFNSWLCNARILHIDENWLNPLELMMSK